MTGLSRRDILRAGAAGGAAAAGLSAGTGTVAASHYDHQPDHVSLSYDEATLSTYQPLLVIDEEDREKLIAQYAWTATSPEYDTDCHVYWTAYTHQDGASPYDSHDGDHEPIYVFVDSQTGEVQEVLASIYHWLKGQADAAALRMDGKQVVLRVMHTYHHYTAASSESSPYEPRLTDLTGAFSDWLENGLEDDLAYGSVVNPWLMHSRTSWWQRDYADISVEEFLVRARRAVGLDEEGSLS